jgi:hypothetical protein
MSNEIECKLIEIRKIGYVEQLYVDVMHNKFIVGVIMHGREIHQQNIEVERQSESLLVAVNSLLEELISRGVK